MGTFRLVLRRYITELKSMSLCKAFLLSRRIVLISPSAGYEIACFAVSSSHCTLIIENIRTALWVFETLKAMHAYCNILSSHVRVKWKR